MRTDVFHTWSLAEGSEVARCIVSVDMADPHIEEDGDSDKFEEDREDDEPEELDDDSDDTCFEEEEFDEDDSC